MRKGVLFVVLLVVLLTFLLSGCVQIDVSTGIDADFTAFLSYHITLDVREFDVHYHSILKHALNNIGWHYQENLGFSVQVDTEADPCVLIMTQRIENNSFGQAYRSLEYMLTNEDMTPFMQVDMFFESFERQNRYLFSASTDISQVMRLSNAEELSPALQEQLEEAMETGEGSFTITFPTSELVSSSHQASVENNQAVMVVPLNYTSETDFELIGVLNLLRDGTPGGTLEEIIGEQAKFRSLSIIASCAAAGVLLIVFVIIIFTRRKRYDF